MKLNKLILLLIIAFAILLFPLKQNPFLGFSLFVYWISSYACIAVNFVFLLSLIVNSRSFYLKLLLGFVFLFYIPLAVYFSRVETEWWNIYDIAPSDMLDQELVFRYYYASYFIAILPFFSLGYILFLKGKDHFKEIV